MSSTLNTFLREEKNVFQSDLARVKSAKIKLWCTFVKENMGLAVSLDSGETDVQYTATIVVFIAH